MTQGKRHQHRLNYHRFHMSGNEELPGVTDRCRKAGAQMSEARLVFRTFVVRIQWQWLQIMGI